MPKIPVLTAQSQGAMLRLPSANAESLGGQAGRSVIGLGNTLGRIDAALQDQKDKLDIVSLEADYQDGLDRAYQESLKEPDIAKQPMVFGKYLDTLNEDLMKRPVSTPVRTAFQIHKTQLDQRAVIALRHEGRKIETERQIVQTSQAAEQRMDQAAAYSQLSPDSQVQDISNLSSMAEALVSGLEKNGHLSPLNAQKMREGLQDRYWSAFARQHPDEMLAMRAGGPTGYRPVSLDWGKLAHYEQVATLTMHAQQVEDDRLRRQQEAAVKQTQAMNANLLTADVLEGKSIADRLPSMLRSRDVDDGVARTLSELQTKMQQAPDMTRYERGLAAQIDASLSALKFSPEALQDGLEQGLVSDFTQGKILKEEFTHLMGVFRGVQEYRQSSGHAALDKEVSHAHTNLVRSLRTTGPADKFDALSEQTITDAEQFFYRKMAQNPSEDPWKIMKQAEDIFKPVVEKRLGLTKTDRMQLDDAKMKGLMDLKAISPSAYKAYRDESQSSRGRAAVEEAIRNLPPPPPPGFMERFFGGKSEPDRSKGVMGAE